MNRTDMTERWLHYAARKTDRQDVFLAGIGIVNEGDNAEYYASVGLEALFRAALAECDGPEEHPAWPCGVKPYKV